MIHIIRICVEYQVGAVAVDILEAVTLLSKTNNIYKVNFFYIVQMYFQSFSELFMGFQTYDTPYRHFAEYQAEAIADHSSEAIT